MPGPFHAMSDEEISKQLAADRLELMKLRFSYAVARSLPNPARVRLLRRNIARMLTVLRARQPGGKKRSGKK